MEAKMKILHHALSSSIFLLLQTFLCFLLLSLPCHSSTNRETLQIGIGIGIGIGGGATPPSPEPEPDTCPPPPPPPCPPPPPLPYPPPPPPPKPPSPPPKSPPSRQPKPPSAPQPRKPSGGPKPTDFPNILQYRAYKVIQAFKKKIYSDPKGIKKTWQGTDLRKYKGFYLDTPPRYKNNSVPTVASIDFNGYKLGAHSVSGLIDRLPDLALFHANSNLFGGTVPDLSKLPYLYELDFSNNKLTGAFPSTVLPLANITFLDLRFNQFAGFVPPSIFLIKLDFLFINNNVFSQPLPTNLGSTSAAYLTLANNAFTGQIPSSISQTNATLLEVLFLGNQLSGCLPPEIGALRKATVFDAGFNQITGPIPRALGCLTKVEQLNFAGNLLYGEIPDEVCRLGIDGGGRLLNLSLSDNYFTSLGKSCLDLLHRGILHIEKNCFLGFADQRSLAECALFLARRKYCPLPNYVPCYIFPESLPVGGGGSVNSSGYASYGTLGKN